MSGKPIPPDPRPTIGQSRAEGMTGFIVYCMYMNARNVRGCDRQARLTFDAIGLPDEVPFLDIPQRRRLICTRCGVRSFDIFPDWRDRRIVDASPLQELIQKRQAASLAALQARRKDTL